ncbi:accessory Sec system S-layer assembly protein [Brevibacillus sp. H7]|uniref:accessory Sec system S-layer assembly protein n=1 Tax=Brevibacillus sp. H7 TaxID=3349138 RepID=UPI0037F7523C
MLSFLKNWLGKTPTSEDVKEQLKEESILVAGEASMSAAKEPKQEQAPTAEGVATALSLHPSWEAKLSSQERYALSFMAQELPPLAEGNLSIAGISLTPHEEGVEVTALLRNGTNRPIRLNTMTLLILFGDQQLFTRQSFDLSQIGEIPPYSARPWTFVFNREHFLQVNVLLTNWKVAFELAQKKLVLPQQLELEESWIKALTDEQKNHLIELAKRLPPLQQGEVNIQSVSISRTEDGLRALLLIRNGSNQSLSLERLPLALYDATGDKVAEGVFELGGLTVNANTSKPWLFIYPQESIIKQEPDFTRWKVSVPQA